MERTATFLRSAGHAPIVMKRELDGFVMNRLQGALLEEAFRLVEQGYAGVEDVDVGIREGLALRWSFMGPFETIDLNAPAGVRDYADRYQGIYSGIFGSTQWRVDWSGPVMDKVDVRAAQTLGRGPAWRASGLARSPSDRACSAQALGGQDHRRLTNSEETRKIGHMAQSNKVIITCAVTGAIHTPSMSPYLPVAPGDIAEAAIAAAEAGAAIIHLHARDPQTGRPDQRPEAFGAFLPDHQRALRCGHQPDRRAARRPCGWRSGSSPRRSFKPELASLNMGSMNFALYPMLKRHNGFKFEWEAPYLEGTRDLVFRNTFADIEFILETCRGNGTRFEFECYDIGHLYNLAHVLDRGLVTPPLFVQSVFGILGGIGPHPEDVAHMRRTADRLFGGDNFRWSVLGAGRNQMPIAAMAVAMGGNVRVGLETRLDRPRQARAIQCPAGKTGARHHREPRT